MINALSKLFGKRAADGMTFHPTGKCPDCSTPLMRATGTDENADWHCPNLDCPAQIRARIEHWCSPAAMDIPGGTAAFVAVLVGKGLVRDVAELYRLKQGEIAALPGMDKDSAKKFFDAITVSGKREAWHVLFGLSIPHLCVEEAKSLCRYFGDVGNVLDANVERLMKADGISEVVARSIVQWHSDSINAKTVKRLYKTGVNFKSGF